MRLSRSNFLNSGNTPSEAAPGTGAELSVQRPAMPETRPPYQTAAASQPYAPPAASHAAPPAMPARAPVRAPAEPPARPSMPMRSALIQKGADEMAASEIEGRRDMPGWQNAFTLSPNVRFSRTPEAVLKRPTAETASTPEPVVTAATTPITEAPARATAPVASQPQFYGPVRAPLPSIPAAPVATAVSVAVAAPMAAAGSFVAAAPAVAEPAKVILPAPPTEQLAQPAFHSVGARAITYRLRRELEQQAQAAALERLIQSAAMPAPVADPAPQTTGPVAAPAVSETATASTPVTQRTPQTSYLSDFAFWEGLHLDFAACEQAEPADAPTPVAAITPPAPEPVELQSPVLSEPVVAPPADTRKVFAPALLRHAGLATAATASRAAFPVAQERDWPVTALYREIPVRGHQLETALEDLGAEPVTVLADPAPVMIEPEPAPAPAPTIIQSTEISLRDLRFSTAPVEGEYEFPPVDLLQVPQVQETAAMTPEALEQSAGLLESVLEDFGIKGEIIDVRPGPVVTLYEFEPAPGVKSSRVIGLSDDIARSMSALSARVAVVPGRNVIGIELPNPVRETVYFREMIESRDYNESRFHLPVCLGKTIGGEPVIAELSKMPHLLVAGTTGSGKSVAINTMILSLLYRLKPEECRLIMVDPKMLELSVYDGIPHLLTPVVTDPKKAVMALKWAVREMEERYKKMSRLGVRNIDGYNTRAASARAKGETILCSIQTGFDRNTGEIVYEQEEMDLTAMPYIVVIVDEMADLMMVAGKEIEGAIQRLAQMARAAGIHLIMATQRPSVDVITGTIKANFPTRISFQVTSKIDSRTILGEPGAEHLLGQGDMLHMVGGGRIARVHGPFVSDEEVEKVVAHLKTQGRPEYLGTVTEDADEAEEAAEEETAVFDKSAMGEEDQSDLYDKAVKLVMRDKKCSTSYIQRRLGVGYNRAASLVERMEQEGLVGPANHVGKRTILVGGREPAIMRDTLEVPGADSDD